MASDDQASPAEIQKFLSGVDYPVPKALLLEHADEQGAPRDVKSVLQAIPDKDYQSPTDVTKEIGRVE